MAVCPVLVSANTFIDIIIPVLLNWSFTWIRVINKCLAQRLNTKSNILFTVRCDSISFMLFGQLQIHSATTSIPISHNNCLKKIITKKISCSLLLHLACLFSLIILNAIFIISYRFLYLRNVKYLKQSSNLWYLIEDWHLMTSPLLVKLSSVRKQDGGFVEHLLECNLFSSSTQLLYPTKLASFVWVYVKP